MFQIKIMSHHVMKASPFNFFSGIAIILGIATSEPSPTRTTLQTLQNDTGILMTLNGSNSYCRNIIYNEYYPNLIFLTISGFSISQPTPTTTKPLQNSTGKFLSFIIPNDALTLLSSPQAI